MKTCKWKNPTSKQKNVECEFMWQTESFIIPS